MLRHQRWIPLLQEAHTHEEVLRVMRSYVDTLLPSDRQMLPESCGPLELSTPEALAETSFNLIRCDLVFHGEETARLLLREVALTFGAATRRLVEIGLPSPTLP